MAKVKCNHCKTKFIYKTVSRHKKVDFDEVRLTIKMDISGIDGKYYCKGCRQSFAIHLIDKVFIIERARLIGMRFPEEKPNWRDVKYKDKSTIINLLEKLRLIKKVKK